MAIRNQASAQTLTIFQISKNNAGRAAAISLILLLVVTPILAQNPAPTPPTDKRDLGIQTNTQPTTSTDQNKAKEAKPELVLQTGYNRIIGATNLAFSPDGRLLATGTMQTHTIKLWEIATGRELRNLSPGGQNTIGRAPAVAFSPDSRLIAVAGGNNTVKVWEVATGRELQSLAGAQGSYIGAIGITYVGFSGDGRKLVTQSDAIRVWDTTSWREVVTLQLSDFNARGMAGLGAGVALSFDGTQLARLTDTEIKLVDLSTGRETRTVEFPDKDLHNIEITFTNDGRLLLAAVEKNKLRLWDLNGKAARIEATATKEYSPIKFTADGRLIALCEDYSVRIWETATGRQLPTINVPNLGVFSEGGGVFAGFSVDGKRIATGGIGTPTLVWETETGKQVMELRGRTNFIQGVAFSPDGTELVTGGRTRWDLRTGQGRRISSSTSDKVVGLPSPDGKLVAMYAPNLHTVTVYDATNGRALQTLTGSNAARGVQRIVFSPDGKLLAVTYMSMPTAGVAWTASSELKIWDAAGGRELQTLTMKMPAEEVGFSADGKQIATVDHYGEIILWDVSSGTRVRSLTATPGQSANPLANLGTFGVPTIPPGQKPSRKNMPQMPSQADIQAMMAGMQNMMNNTLGAMAAGTMGKTVTSLIFSPDGRMVATGGFESKTNLDLTGAMNPAQGKQKKQPPKSTDDMMKNLKVETTGQIALWDPGTGQQIGIIKGHGTGITEVAFSQDAKLIASAASDNTIKLWDLASKSELRTLTGHTANIEAMDFSPDGKLLVSVSDDGSTFLWDTTTGEHLLTLISLDDGGEWMVVTPDGLFDGTPQSWNQILWRYDQDTFNVAPVEWFFNEFYHPGLLSDIYAGKRPHVTQDISKKDRRQPIVKLSLSGGSATDNIANRVVKIKIDVTDAPADKEHPRGSGARDVRLFRNGSLVKVWHGDALKGQSTISLEQDIELVAGPNRLVAYAFNNDNVKSKDANLALNGAESLKRAGTVWVIAVGVNEYTNPQYNLKYAVADAESFAAEITREQVPLGRFDKVQVVPLLNNQATKENILAAITRLSGSTPTISTGGPLEKITRAQPEDAVIIYFAGHGTAQGQRFYLIPHDLGYTGERAAINASGLQAILSHSISDQELELAVEEIPAGSFLMVIDACNSGQALEAEEKRRGPMNSKGLAQLAYEKGMYILTAAQSYQAALEAAQLGHGLLTYALVEEGLKQGAADTEPKDGVVNAREWLDFATERVPQMQEEKMKQSRDLGLNIAFTEGEQKIDDPNKRTVQRPRVFYRREMEANPLVVARTGSPK